VVVTRSLASWIPETGMRLRDFGHGQTTRSGRDGLIQQLRKAENQRVIAVYTVVMVFFKIFTRVLSVTARTRCLNYRVWFLSLAWFTCWLGSHSTAMHMFCFKRVPVSSTMIRFCKTFLILLRILLSNLGLVMCTLVLGKLSTSTLLHGSIFPLSLLCLHLILHREYTENKKHEGQSKPETRDTRDETKDELRQRREDWGRNEPETRTKRRPNPKASFVEDERNQNRRRPRRGLSPKQHNDRCVYHMNQEKSHLTPAKATTRSCQNLPP